jgi:penicillin amidase
VKAWLKAVISGVFAIALVGALGHRFGLVPPMGAILNPFNGAWKRTPGLFEKGVGHLQLHGLTAPVQIVVDQDQIKHVFAANDHDLYMAQGFIVASERLWQMEFLVRTASGRLSEIMGPKTLDYDIYFTRIGLPAAAEASAAVSLADPVSGPALRAYADGVNAFIATLTPQTVPFEYKLLGVSPEAWSPKTAGYLLKFMAWSMTGGSSEIPLSRSEHVLGRAGFDELFPIDLKVPEPIVPPGTHQIVKSVAPAAPKDFFEPSVDSLQPMPTPHPMNGSNNWAVSGKKSVTGLPILSNDIHLSLSLPALWYEMQLVSPTQNVYGIAMPGAPGIILGFNKSIAWGATNGADDILDWFQLRFRDEKRSEYLYDGVWHPVISHEVRIKVRGEDAHILTVRETHFGPIVYDKTETPLSPNVGRGLALRWLALSESNEIKNFMQMNRATNIETYRAALEGYQTPAMNFLCADNKGQIALWQFGRFPLKWKGQGRLIGDGSNSDYDWKGFLVSDEVPTVKNPSRGFISSANQAPFEVGDSPFYFGWPFETPYRATRINELLRAKAKFTPEDFVKMQRDTLAVSTRQLTPVLRSALKAVTLDERETKALSVLDHWDFRYEEDSQGAPLAYAWYKETEWGLWSRLFPERKSFYYPPLPKTIEILRDPTSHWYDNPATEKIETRADIVRSALDRAIGDVEDQTGYKDPTRWTWAAYRPTDVGHLSKLPGLGHDQLAAAGMEHAIFANSGTHGPVWKLVVAVNPSKPRAWGVYPGGQSGDPFSPHYEDFLGAWRRGEMKELQFMNAPADSDTRRLGQMSLEVGQ